MLGREQHDVSRRRGRANADSIVLGRADPGAGMGQPGDETHGHGDGRPKELAR